MLHVCVVGANAQNYCFAFVFVCLFVCLFVCFASRVLSRHIDAFTQPPNQATAAKNNQSSIAAVSSPHSVMYVNRRVRLIFVFEI